MYLRFVITKIDDTSHKPQGLFVTSNDLLDEGELSPDQRDQLRELMIWFNKNLPSPKIGYASRAIFWFKSDAEDCIKRMWELVNLLREYGYHVDMYKYRELGNIIYEDRFQVACYPSNDD